MDWVQAAAVQRRIQLESSEDGTESDDVASLSSHDVQLAIEATQDELDRVRQRGGATRRRQWQQVEELHAIKTDKLDDLELKIQAAKQATTFWEYAKIIREEFEKDNLPYSWYGWGEAWLLRSIHHAMIVKQQHDIVQADCNHMLMDLFETIPKIKEEQNLAEAVALNNLGKMDSSTIRSKEQYQQYVELQHHIIAKLQRLQEEDTGGADMTKSPKAVKEGPLNSDLQETNGVKSSLRSLGESSHNDAPEANEFADQEENNSTASTPPTSPTLHNEPERTEAG